MGGVWFITIGRGTSGRCMVCMGNGMETRSVVAHDKVNGQWERQGSIKHDELRDMGHLVPMRKEA
jgi:hypothetical protein